MCPTAKCSHHSIFCDYDIDITKARDSRFGASQWLGRSTWRRYSERENRQAPTN
jgi:hypothetical protein